MEFTYTYGTNTNTMRWSSYATTTTTNGTWLTTGDSWRMLNPCECLWDMIELAGSFHKVRVSGECPHCVRMRERREYDACLESIRGAS